MASNKKIFINIDSDKVLEQLKVKVNHYSETIDV